MEGREQGKTTYGSFFHSNWYGNFCRSVPSSVLWEGLGFGIWIWLGASDGVATSETSATC